ncbi:MAG: LLM class flavin-dependent oxidoreductase, partial [Candidatus Bathyarchaeota archaeon]
MVLDIGAAISGEAVDKIGSLCRLLDRGFTHLWIGDVIGSGYPRDQLVTMALAALNTKNAKIGTSVTGPYVRHPFLT